jgi:transposase-like protein
LDHEGEHSSRWAAVSSIAAKVDCMAQTLHEWVKKAERDRLGGRKRSSEIMMHRDAPTSYVKNYLKWRALTMTTVDRTGA